MNRQVVLVVVLKIIAIVRVIPIGEGVVVVGVVVVALFVLL